MKHNNLEDEQQSLNPNKIYIILTLSSTILILS